MPYFYCKSIDGIDRWSCLNCKFLERNPLAKAFCYSFSEELEAREELLRFWTLEQERDKNLSEE